MGARFIANIESFDIALTESRDLIAHGFPGLKENSSMVKFVSGEHIKSMQPLNMELPKRNFGDTIFIGQTVTANPERLNKAPDLDELEILAKKFAPVINFHNNAEVLPVNAENYFRSSWLVNGDDKSKVPAGNTGFPGHTEQGPCFYLEPNDANKAVHQSPRAYVHARAHNGTHTDLQYWFLYAQTGFATAGVKWLIDETIKGFDGKIHLDPLGKFNGTWEWITIRINNQSREAEQVYFPQRGNGKWYPVNQVTRKGSQVMVFASRDNGSFFPTTIFNSTENTRFNLYSSQLDFCIHHEIGKGLEIDFAGSSELISADYLRQNKPSEPFWLNFRHHWGNPNPDYLSVAVVKRMVPAMFGKSLDFLLSRDLLDEVVNYLILYFREQGSMASLAPKSRNCWGNNELS